MPQFTIDREELAWATGLFDGEGTIGLLCKRGHDLRVTTRITPSGSRWCSECQPIRVRELRIRKEKK